ncbi:MAG: leucine--tRNA ligase [Candidatus Edwardsbacteria bacterium]
MKYPFKEIESKWQKIWEETGLYKTNENPRKKFYMLEMFAYTSGDIHMGHFRNYAIGDVIARYKMMQGYDILHPIGWDAFGLPAEEAAITRSLDPEKWTLGCIEVSRNTLKKMGISYDWNREVITCLPNYYKWTQWVFLKLFERGLAYQGESLVNWCPGCKTVLANEQVEQGTCWRCHSQVTKKTLKQWFFKITEYAERLLKSLDRLTGWPENVKTMQKNWIGKSIGTEIDFSMEKTGKLLSVFTTRPDTIYGVTFIAIAPENPLAKKIVEGTRYEKEVLKYIEKSILKTEIERVSTVTEKDGIFTGEYAINPLSRERVQLWVVDYVLASYGTGVVMGVPGHDQRDFEFARRYDIPIKVVIQPPGQNLDPSEMKEAYTEPGTMVNSGSFDGIPSEIGIKRVTDYVIEKGRGREKVNYKLRDWLISRQRYWGAPIPIIHCEKCGIVSVPEKDLPVLLPKGNIDFIPKGRSPLADVKEFTETKCSKCQDMAQRDPDTMDTFVCSSWYFLRYTDAHNDCEPFSKDKVKKWFPIDLYIGGVEHACGHLLYFRFITKVLFDAGYLPIDEPTFNLFNHGMVLDKNGEVMSKSKGNLISPVELMENNGVDASRLAMFFFAPSEREIIWNEESTTGTTRFINRIYNLVQNIKEYPLTQETQLPKTSELNEEQIRLCRKLNKYIKYIEQDIVALQFNTIIAKLMDILTDLEKIELNNSFGRYCLVNFIKLLALFAPHLGEELWQKMEFGESIFKSSWPVCDESVLKEEEITYIVEVNGKVRGRVSVPAETGEEEVKKKTMENEKVKGYLAGKEIKKAIFVPKKLVNFVVG